MLWKYHICIMQLELVTKKGNATDNFNFCLFKLAHKMIDVNALVYVGGEIFYYCSNFLKSPLWLDN